MSGDAKVRKNYCRACGENKGHNFSTCKNVNGLRKIIVSQDGQIESGLDLQARLKRAETLARDYEITARFYQRIIEKLCEVKESK